MHSLFCACALGLNPAVCKISACLPGSPHKKICAFLLKSLHLKLKLILHVAVQVLDLIPVSDSITKLTADCAYCGQPALFSLRIAADQRQEVVGGADKYAPVCRHHYVSLSQLRGP